MPETRTNQLGRLVKAIVNQKPSDFADTFNTMFQNSINDTKSAIKTDLKTKMFKSGKHEVDIDKIVSKEEPTPEPAKDEPIEPTINNKLINGLNQTLSSIVGEPKGDNGAE